mmetsp:Transcript_39529/g.93031  ORF Transcript_39529/g.93031 Transcript_39529/m.93031 type:complete len:230 (-) Transcript_39529:2314-3003(-)
MPTHFQMARGFGPTSRAMSWGARSSMQARASLSLCTLSGFRTSIIRISLNRWCVTSFLHLGHSETSRSWWPRMYMMACTILITTGYGFCVRTASMYLRSTSDTVAAVTRSKRAALKWVLRSSSRSLVASDALSTMRPSPDNTLDTSPMVAATSLMVSHGDSSCMAISRSLTAEAGTPIRPKTASSPSRLIAAVCTASVSSITFPTSTPGISSPSTRAHTCRPLTSRYAR